MTAIGSVEAEFDRCVTELLAVRTARSDDEARRGPRPAISTETIYQRTLELLDAEGAAALTVRTLAADLGISTRTLYKRIIDRDNVIRCAVQRYTASFEPVVEVCGTWEQTAMRWCLSLHRWLLDHPHLTNLMTDDDGLVLVDAGSGIAEYAVQEGIPTDVAVHCTRSLITVTVNDAMAATRTVDPDGPQASPACLAAAERLPMTLGWILAGVRASV